MPKQLGLALPLGPLEGLVEIQESKGACDETRGRGGLGEIGRKGANMAEPNREDMERAKIVLDDALTYELDMLDAAARYMQTDEFAELTNRKTEVEWLTCNATIESFWTHARCVMEFFCRRKNKDFTASAASAMDFTEGFYPSSEMEKLWGPGKLSETINEQVGHVGFCRKAEQLQKLGASEMVRVKSIIDKEVGKFERTLKREFQPYWKSRQLVPLRLESLNKNVSSATSQGGSWKIS
jgi:hypothetical protein